MSCLECQECIVLLCRGSGLGLEPVSEMCRASVHCPDTNRVCNCIRSSLIKSTTTSHLTEELSVCWLREGLGDLCKTKDTLAKEFRGVDWLAILGGVGDLSAWSHHIVTDGIFAGLVS